MALVVPKVEKLREFLRAEKLVGEAELAGPDADLLVLPAVPAALLTHLRIIGASKGALPTSPPLAGRSEERSGCCRAELAGAGEGGGADGGGAERGERRPHAPPQTQTHPSSRSLCPAHSSTLPANVNLNGPLSVSLMSSSAKDFYFTVESFTVESELDAKATDETYEMHFLLSRRNLSIVLA